MITPKAFWIFFALAFIGLLIVLIVGIILLTIFVDELTESRAIVSDLVGSWRNNSGDEFTGEATALLFVASIIPIGFDLISRMIIRYFSVGEMVKGIIRRINNGQRKYLVPFHTYLSILALGVGILHLRLSSCITNPLPEIGLILAGTLVGTGLLSTWKSVPTTFRKYLYQFHASLIVSGILFVILITGHAVMDLD
jgi:hypothetical protein